MKLNIYEAMMQKAYLFGTLVLYSGLPIPREDVPEGWYCYDLRGTSRAPDTPYSVVDQTDNYHTGSVLSPVSLKSERDESRLVEDQFYLTQEFSSLHTFCADENIVAPKIPFRYQAFPATPGEASLFFDPVRGDYHAQLTAVDLQEQEMHLEQEQNSDPVLGCMS